MREFSQENHQRIQAKRTSETQTEEDILMLYSFCGKKISRKVPENLLFVLGERFDCSCCSSGSLESYFWLLFFSLLFSLSVRNNSDSPNCSQSKIKRWMLMKREERIVVDDAERITEGKKPLSIFPQENKELQRGSRWCWWGVWWWRLVKSELISSPLSETRLKILLLERWEDEEEGNAKKEVWWRRCLKLHSNETEAAPAPASG